MARVNIYEDDEVTGMRTLAGWFNPDAGEKFDQARYHDGANWISKATASQWHDEWLYRTAQGRWVLGSYSRYNSDHQEHYRFITADEACDWLLRNECDEDVQRLFGTLEEEAGPDVGGRPAIGPAVNIRLTPELLGRVDRAAVEAGETRAEAIRRLLTTALA